MDAPLHMQTDRRGVCTLTLHRPECHNAFNAELLDAFLTTLQTISTDPSIRIVILTGSGASFCSGADLQWMREAASHDQDSNRQDAEQLARLMLTLYQLDKPTVARVNGPAYGGGLGLMACCDIAITSIEARFAFTEVRLGLVPAVIAPYVLRAIGPRQARRWFLSAESFSSSEALKLGLVHQVVDANNLDDAVEDIIDRLLLAGPVAVMECKRLIGRLADHDSIDTADLIARLRASPEGREGMAAFLEKRKPDWVAGAD